MNDFRSVLVRMGLRARSGSVDGVDARFGDSSVNEDRPGDEKRNLSIPVRSPAWLVLEILLVAILVFFWL